MEKEKLPRAKASLRRKIFRGLTMFTLIYCSAGLLFYYCQDKFLLHPIALDANYKYAFSYKFKEVNIPMEEDVNLNVLQFFPKDSAKGVVLYFHGNTGNAGTFAHNAEYFTEKGYELWIPDYPGFGKSTGEFKEALVNSEARQVYKLARHHFPEDKIIVYGLSLGTGPAAYIAAKQKIRLLILNSPYSSLPSLFSRYAPIYPMSRMANYKFPVDEYLKETPSPVIIFHGTADKTIPYRESSKLKKVLKPIDQFISIEEGGHNNLPTFPIYQQKMDSILR